MEGFIRTIGITILISLAQISFAQKVLNDATITYSISVQSSDGKTDLAKSLEGATLTIYLKGTHTRSDMVSSLGTESGLYDTRTGKGYILKEYSGQKLMITMDKNNWSQKNQFYQNATFVIDNAEQQINGFRTKKATSTLPDGKSFVVNFTPDFVTANKQYNNSFAKLPGLPVQYEITSGNLMFTYKLVKIDQEIVSATKFEVPKSGYRVMTYDENQQLKKGENKR